MDLNMEKHSILIFNKSKSKLMLLSLERSGSHGPNGELLGWFQGPKISFIFTTELFKAIEGILYT